MRKWLFFALAGYLWKKYGAKNLDVDAAGARRPMVPTSRR